MKLKTMFFLGLAIALIGWSQADAMLLIGNLDQPPWNYWNDNGSPIGQAFTTGDAVTIDSVTFRYDYGAYDPLSTPATFEIHAADGAGKIGERLDTWAGVSASYPLVTFTGTASLAANTTYWLLMVDAHGAYGRVSGTTAYTANFGASLPTQYNNFDMANGGAYYSLADNPMMFQVTAVDAQSPDSPPATVPEPSTVLLFGSGLLGLGVWRRKKFTARS